MQRNSEASPMHGISAHTKATIPGLLFMASFPSVRGPSTCLCPGGALENSPAIYRWVRIRQCVSSPGGTVETSWVAHVQSSLRDYRFIRVSNPAINRWAILKRPSGTDERPYRTANVTLDPSRFGADTVSFASPAVFSDCT